MTLGHVPGSGQVPLAMAAAKVWAGSRPGSSAARRVRHSHRHACPGLLHQAQDGPKNPCAGMTLYQVLRELQIVLAVILGTCPLCCQPVILARLAAALAGT